MGSWLCKFHEVSKGATVDIEQLFPEPEWALSPRIALGLEE